MSSNFHFRRYFPEHFRFFRDRNPLETTLSAATDFTARVNTTLRVTADSGWPNRRCWLLTQPIDSAFMQQWAAYQWRPPIYLRTTSRHQGWVELPEQGSWSWIELAIVSQLTPDARSDQVSYDHVKTVLGRKLAWISHFHPVTQDSTFAQFNIRFPENHEIWSYLQVGDRLAVFGCAQYYGWSCYGMSAELKIGGNAPGQPGM